MSMLKMNVLHWHITDDQSFPIEIKKYPHLHTDGAGWLGYTHNQGTYGAPQTPGRFYSQKEISEIVEFAELRGVRIIPEIDMPTHTRSWGRGYPEIISKCPSYVSQRASHLKGQYVVNLQLDISVPKTFEIVEAVISEVWDLFPDPIMHVGGDEFFPECWEEDVAQTERIYQTLSEASFLTRRRYFDRKIREIIKKKGESSGTKKNIMYWSEAFTDGVIPGIQETTSTIIQIWNARELASTTSSEFPFVMSNGFYLDLQYNDLAWWNFYTRNPLQGVPYQNHHLFMGAEACAWELTESPSYSNELLPNELTGTWFRGWDSKVWLKLIAFSENVWSGPSIRSSSESSVAPVIREVVSRMKSFGIDMPDFCQPYHLDVNNPEVCFPKY
eukprot:TRINITY_DN515_c0_g1_i3.p1 TRINITY_DN515_c0_g1~~TRINITY_DN515_c0_g1_i3.p1  ORF type:complete len:386 (-),score=44.60 TRINITY_DN515_c0_g1_i3:91-1248(-)